MESLLLMQRRVAARRTSPEAIAMAALPTLRSTLPSLPPQDSSPVGVYWFNPSPWSASKAKNHFRSGSPWKIPGRGWQVHLSLMHHQRNLRFQLTFISQNHTLHTDVVVDNVALAVKEEAGGHSTEDKAKLQRLQHQHPMEERYHQPLWPVEQTLNPTPTKNTTIGTCVFRVDMKSRSGTPAPPVTISNQDIRQGALGPVQNNTPP